MGTTKRAAWTPQPGPQADAITATWCEELLYGGAKFGGKSDFLLGDFLQDVPRYQQHWHGILFRQSLPEMEDIIRRSHEIYASTGAVWGEQKRTWTWPTHGSSIKFRYLENVRDFWGYNGHSYGWIGVDELGQWVSLEGYHMLKGCLRWGGAELPTKRIRASANPGGPGHSVVKEYFIDPAPHGYQAINNEEGMVRMFIPARYTDNKIGIERDPGYIGRLHSVGTKELVRAWLDGDWNVTPGAYFPEFSHEHIIQPFGIPPAWNKFGAFDWGSSHPYCFLWFAVSDGSISPYPKESLIVYREDYGAASANVGLKLTAEEVADRILGKMSSTDKLLYIAADPECWHRKGGPTLAERMQQRGLVNMRPADNNRIPGWDMLRQRFKGLDGSPMIYIFNTCHHLIRCLPLLQRDIKHPEDADTTGEDHPCDTIRYGAMSRPWVAPQAVRRPDITRQSVTLDRLLADKVAAREQY